MKNLTKLIQDRYKDEMNEFSRKSLGQNIPELNLYEKVLIFVYTKFLWEDINEKLRERKPHELEPFLNSALKKLPNYEGVVYRGVNLSREQKEVFRKLSDSEENFIELGFFSTSYSKFTADGFSKGDTVFEIISKNGKNIEDISYFGMESPTNEKEILFCSKSIFQVLEVEQRTSKTIIYLEEIAR